ncbi:MAG TPA: hypothetical protein PLJ78_04195 [Anaerolineae bacterium]|nr:hypothetical protein [Anaerolineae bacterium]HQK13132.1 hypothetical protein [Anaerolineae bacterium]
MLTSKQMDLQYITDASGKKTAVVLPIAEFQALMEDLADLAIAAERYAEPTISHANVVAELKHDGLLYN